jgi:hypothetical protein
VRQDTRNNAATTVNAGEDSISRCNASGRSRRSAGNNAPSGLPSSSDSGHRDRAVCIEVFDIACSQFFLYSWVRGPDPIGEGVELAGRYLATQTVYHSLVTERDDAAPGGLLGWREVTMVPADENWEAIDALART